MVPVGRGMTPSSTKLIMGAGGKRFTKSIFGDPVAEIERLLKPVELAEKTLERCRRDLNTKSIANTEIGVSVIHEDIGHGVSSMKKEIGSLSVNITTLGESAGRSLVSLHEKADSYQAKQDAMLTFQQDFFQQLKKSDADARSASWAQFMTPLYTLIEDLRRTANSHPAQKFIIAQRSIRQNIMEVICSADERASHANEIVYILQRHYDFGEKALAQAQYLLQTPEFRRWFMSPYSEILLVDGHCNDESIGRLAPTSLTCAGIARAMLGQDPNTGAASQPEVPRLTLYFFIGEHMDYNSGYYGPNGLIRSFIAQILRQWPVEENMDLEMPGNDPSTWTSDMNSLCYLFEQLVCQLGPNFPVWCIVDGLSRFETGLYGWLDDLTAIIGSFLFCKDKKSAFAGRGAIKVLLVSSDRSIRIRDMVEDQDRVDLRAGNILLCIHQTTYTLSQSQMSQFAWRRSSQGVWERGIDECENFYRLFTKNDHGCYPITGCASFQIKTPDVDQEHRVEKALRNAWTLLRFKHPTLGSRMELDNNDGRWKRFYTPFQTDEDVNCWLQSTFKTIDSGQSALEWFNNSAPDFELPTVYLVRSDHNAPCQTIFLRCPHDITDGVGILQLVDQLFTQASLVYAQSTAYPYPLPDDELDTRLSPSLRIAGSIPDSLSEAQMQRHEDIQSENGAVYNHHALLSLPPSSSSDTYQVQRVAVSVPKAVSSQILANCKAIAPGVSVTHVFTAALAMALRDLQPRKQGSYAVRYVNHAMINLRPYCRPPYNSPAHAAAAYHTVSAQALGIDLDVPALADDKEYEPSQLPLVATQVRDFYNRVKPVLSQEAHEQNFLAPLTFKALSPPPGSDPYVASDPPFCPVALSSIGNISSIVSAASDVFELTNVWAASQPIGAGVATFLGCWDGNIELSGVFNMQYHNRDYLETFLEAVLSYVCQGLGVDSS
ncbi:unnamed protein product [Fusarium equiseti]|uniref:Uncharacterized protein n=1 Tax=Fusarium equiseti TaxID=61235 RepID=A0A8J2IX10_FUSEQ|nr:unnamed protein product [Fusarium equiseti]